MKKFMVMLFIAAMACSLAGCGKKSDDVFEPEEEHSWERIEREAKDALETGSEEPAPEEAVTEVYADPADPAFHYEGHEEDILWGGNFALSHRDLDSNARTEMEFSGDGSYFSIHTYNAGMNVTMAGIGNDFYLATADGVYRVTDGDTGEELAGQMGGSSSMMIDFSTLEHTGYDYPHNYVSGDLNCYVYQVKTVDGSTLKIYVNRDWQTVEVMVPDPDNAENNMHCEASELTERSFDPADYDMIEDVSADDAAGILASAMLGSALEDGTDPGMDDAETALEPEAE